MEQKLLFFGFAGPQIDQVHSVCEIADGYECWDLTKFDLDGFIRAIQDRIPPVNTNVLRFYRRDTAAANDMVAVTEHEFHACSWGLLVPDAAPDALGDCAETLFLLNLYSPHFLYPSFYATQMGITRPDHGKRSEIFHDHEQVERFRHGRFVMYYQALLTESQYARWHAYRIACWNKEDWRLFVACLLYSELKAYENSKYALLWQRESADMATILEALFTAGGNDTNEVGYKLRKRAAVLIGSRLPTIEQDIKTPYDERSSFVHGSFFQKIAKKARILEGYGQLPLPPFDIFYRHKECVRYALIAYLYLSKIHRSTSEFEGFSTVMNILEDAIINLEVRSKVRKHVDHILSLCL